MPVTLWILSTIGAYFTAGETVFEYSGYISICLLASLLGYLNRFSANDRKKRTERRHARNTFIPSALNDIDKRAVPAPPESDRELTLCELRKVQYLIDQANRGPDDWTDFNIIDQFQTSALRYQIYESMYCLSAYQGIYAPNCHAYVSQALRNLIEKALLPKVNNFWKWETLWGKFSTDYDPIKKDNIMVSGFFLQGLMLYTANTGDTRYAKPGALKFKITNNIEYPHSIHSIAESLARQWKSNPYCFFPCEPNWIYTPCNFQGLIGEVIYDRFFDTNYVKDVIGPLEDSLTVNFTEEDGSILPIRSELTGFTLPGLCGALGDLVNALFCRGHLDHIARRMWAIFRTESVRFDPVTGGLELVGLVGADKLDAGNYKTNEYNIFGILSFVAGEFGDEDVRKAAIKILNEKIGFETMPTGSMRLKGVSNSSNSCMVRGQLLRNSDWKNLIAKGPSNTTLAGPILTQAPYPGVLVAKARSHTSKDLDLVFYPSKDPGIFGISVSRLIPGKSYSFDNNGKRAVVAGSDGSAKIDVFVEGRTQVHLVLAKNSSL